MINTAYRNDALGFLFGAFPNARPNKYYVGISTTALSKDGTGITEPGASTNYKRIEIPNTAAFWNQPTDGRITNKVEIKFDELTADAPSAVQFFISTSQTGDAIWWDYIYNSEGSIITRPLVQYGTVYINPGDFHIDLVNEDI